MADNIAITAGTGTNIATDDEASVHYQKVKLASGITGETAGVGVDVGVKANALRVAPANDITDGTYIGDIKFGEALPAGTAAIGKLAANDGVDIGDVSVNNTVTVDLGANNDVTVTSGTVTANLGATDNAVLDDIEAQTSAASVATEGSALASGVLIQGDDGTDRKNINVDATTGDVQVDVTNTVTVDLGANNDVTVTSGAITETNSGAIKTAVELIDNAISGSEMQVDVVAALPAGTNAIGKLAANSGVDIGDVDVTSITGVTMSNAAIQSTGDEAHDAADAGNPIKIGAKAVNFDGTAPVTPVAENDRTNALSDTHGALLVRTDQPYRWSYHYNGSSAQTDTQVQAAPGAGLSVYITDIVFSTGAATACNIFFEEGASTKLGPYYLEAVAGRGVVMNFKTPYKCTANTALTVTTSAAIAQAIDVQGFIAP